MLKLISRIALPLVLLACVQIVSAQDKGGPEFNMTCQEVLRLGLDKFTDVYGEKTKDYSTVGMKGALGYYVDCKRPANDALARRLGAAKRQKVNQVREDLSKIGNAAWDMAFIAAGGGTIYGLAAVSAYAAREDFMTTFITALTPPNRSQPTARRRANASLAKAGRLLARLSRMPRIEVFGDQSLAEQQKLYRGFVKEAQDASARLTVLIRDLPDLAAERAAGRMAAELEVDMEQ